MTTITPEILFVVVNPLGQNSYHYRNELTEEMQHHYNDLSIKFPYFFVIVEACPLSN